MNLREAVEKAADEVVEHIQQMSVPKDYAKIFIVKSVMDQISLCEKNSPCPDCKDIAFVDQGTSFICPTCGKAPLDNPPADPPVPSDDGKVDVTCPQCEGSGRMAFEDQGSVSGEHPCGKCGGSGCVRISRVEYIAGLQAWLDDAEKDAELAGPELETPRAPCKYPLPGEEGFTLDMGTY